MKTVSKDERLLAEFANLLEVRNSSLCLERQLFALVVLARKRGLEPAYRKSLQGVLFCLRSSIALMNNELYSGRFRNMKPSCQFSSESDELPF